MKAYEPKMSPEIVRLGLRNYDTLATNLYVWVDPTGDHTGVKKQFMADCCSILKPKGKFVTEYWGVKRSVYEVAIERNLTQDHVAALSLLEIAYRMAEIGIEVRSGLPWALDERITRT